MRKILSAMLVCALLALGACADAGVEPDVAARFKPGETTRAQVVAVLGKPAAVYQAADQTETLTWAKDDGLFNPDTKSLSIKFGPDDRMIAVVARP